MSSNANYYPAQKLRFIRRKLELIVFKGSKCLLCGYSGNLAALEFHHRDPTIKGFPLDARHIANTEPKKLLVELEKCDLLCANCHREVHNPEKSMGNINVWLGEQQVTYKDTLAGRKKVVRLCPTCSEEITNYSTGKVFCSRKCRFNKVNYPTIEQLLEAYFNIMSWEKVAKHFGVTRRVVQGIRKRARKSLVQSQSGQLN